MNKYSTTLFRNDYQITLISWRWKWRQKKSSIWVNKKGGRKFCLYNSWTIPDLRYNLLRIYIENILLLVVSMCILYPHIKDMWCEKPQENIVFLPHLTHTQQSKYNQHIPVLYNFFFLSCGNITVTQLYMLHIFSLLITYLITTNFIVYRWKF